MIYHVSAGFGQLWSQAYLEVTGEEVLHERNGPLLKCLWQNSVVGVAESGLHDAPSLVPFQTLLVDQDALKLGNGKCWVGVVEL